MTLIITAVAAIIATVIRFLKPELAVKAHIGFLALMYWGASLMWSVDGFAAVAEGEAFVELADTTAMADDALLGLCVVLLGLAVWGIVFIVNRVRASKSSIPAR